MSSTASKLASGSVLRVLNFVAQVLVAFFLMPFVVHSLGDRLYGFWTLVGTFIGYYGLVDMGLSDAVSRHIAGAIGEGDSVELNRVYNTALLLFSCLGFVALLITVGVAGLSPWLWDTLEDTSLFSKVVLLLGVNFAINLPFRVYIGVLYGQLRFDVVSGIQMASLMLRTVLVVWVLSLGHKVLALALVTLLSSIPANLLYAFFARKILPSLRFHRKYRCLATVKTLFSYSIFVFISRIAERLRFHTDAFIIAAFVSLPAVTHYRIASLIIDYFNNLMGASFGVLTPYFSRRDGANENDAIRKTFFFATKISVCASSFVGFGLIVWGKHFIQRWMGPDYLDAYPCLVVLVLGIVFALWQSPSIALLYGTSKHKFPALCGAAEGVCNLLLSLLLVRDYGFIGVAIGTSLPMTVNRLIVMPVYFCHASSITYREYVGRIARTIIVVCICLAFPYLISVYFSAPNFRTLSVLGFISLFTYSLGIWVFEFTSEERRILCHALLPKFSAGKITN